MFESCEGLYVAFLCGFLAGVMVGEGGLFKIEVLEVHQTVLVTFEADEARLFG